MLTAATTRFSRGATPSSSQLSPATRQERRLSRISPSEFDSVLNSGETVKLASPDAAAAASDVALSPSAARPSPDPATKGAPSTSAPWVPPGLGPEPHSNRPLRRARSLVADAAERQSPARSPVGSGGGDALEVLDDPRILDADSGRAYIAEGAHPSADDWQGSTRSASIVHPTSPSTRRPSSSSRDPQPSNPNRTLSRDSTAAARRDSKGEKPRLSNISTLSTGSYVHVPFPPVENRPEAAESRRIDPSASSSSFARGFDFSPVRKRAQSAELEDGKACRAFPSLSLAGTMRKTSRFFRKLGGSNSPAHKASPDCPPRIGPPSDLPAFPQSMSVPSTPTAGSFGSSMAPPVPAIPSSFTASTSASSTSLVPASRQAPAPRDPRVNRRDLPRLPSTKLIPSPGQTRSAATLRDNSSQSLLTNATQASVDSSLRRRSMGFDSIKPEVPERERAPLRLETGKHVRRPSTRTEDDQLRHELKLWRLGVDGVLGTAVSGNLPTSPSLGTTSSTGSHSSPQLHQDLAHSNSALSSGSSSFEKRRASVPATTKELPPIAATRAAILPNSTLLPIQYLSTSVRRPSSSGSSHTPEIRLTPSSRNGSVSSAVTVGPYSSGMPVLGHASTSASSTTSSATEEGVGLGLSTIDEAAARSRELNLGPVTPTRDSFAAAAAVSKPLPLQPKDGDAGTASNRSKGARGSIVALPPLAPAAHAGTSRSSSTGSRGAAGRGKGRKKTADAAIDQALSEEELQEKAGVLAEQAWDEDESFLERKKIAEWLGSSGRINATALRRYIDHFDFGDLRLDVAFRRLCGKLYLKAETQQVDRILEQFSRRYFEDNPETVYGSADVVHAVSYSLLLLNTDLHVVDTTTRMTRQQFIRNTLEAIHAQTGDSAEVIASPLLVDEQVRPASPVFRSPEASTSRKSLDRVNSDKDKAPGVYRSATSPNRSPASSSPNLAISRVTTRTGSEGQSSSPARPLSVVTARVNEAGLQAALKDMYNAIKSQPIYQISSESRSSSALHLPQEPVSRSSFSLAPGNSPYATWNGNVSRATSRRSATSVASGAPSASSSMAYKRSSIRGMGALLGASSSLDLIRSQSPTPSTATSLSDERWNTAYGPPSQHHAVPTIGFASNLSHAIIREQQEDDARSEASTVEIADDELALLGAPWAKEGMLTRKHYWETTGRRAKDKNWVQAFVVVSQGELKMFRFDGTGAGANSRALGGVGGGDWTANASTDGSISLIHALCSAMPPPGYSRERPHCFVLTLPGGGSYFFQAGTPDLVTEWVSTCNYWSARLSKEPLSGGVSNMEYGWSRVDSPQNGDDDEREEIASIRSGHSRRSYASSRFHGSALGGGGSADRIHVNEWKPPQVPLAPSQLAEETQLEALKRHTAIVQRELAQHNMLRVPMLRLFPSSRGTSASKALDNWERKSRHLLAESVKYRTYVDALAGAVQLRALQRGQRQVARMLESADADADADAAMLVASLSLHERNHAAGPPEPLEARPAS
ncbi:hypothetical protein JCM3770_001269 [Rhodotorula araucariae]